MEDELLSATGLWAVHSMAELNCTACETQELWGEGIVFPSVEV